MNEKHIKVLLIEDNPGDARLIQEMLNETKGVTFDSECTNRLSTGLARISEGGIDVILLDLSLPDSKGLETFTETQAQSRGIPIIVLSGLDDEELTVKAVQEGAQDYLVKGQVEGNLLSRSIRYSIERKRLEETLRENEEKYRNLIEGSHDLIQSVQPDGSFNFVNRAWLETLEYSVEELENISIFDIIHPGSLPHCKEMFSKVISGESLNNIEAIFMTKNGNNIQVEGNVAPRILGKKVIGSQGFFHDITERKKAEEALQDSETKYRNLVERANDGIVIIQDDIIKYANPRMIELAGCPVEEVINSPFTNYIHPDEVPKLIERHKRRIEGEDVDEIYETILKRKDGSDVYTEINAGVIPYQGKLGDLVFVRDITERKRNEDQIKTALKEKEVLLKEIHHRVKNNLQVISSLLKLQSRNIKDEEVQEMFKDSQNRVRSMALIHEKLYQSKDLANIEIRGYVWDLVSHLFQSYNANTGNIALQMYIEDVSLGVEAAIPCGLIINELVSNSLKYAFPDDRKGEINITMLSPDEERVQLKISDNGIGLPEDFDVNKTESLGLHLVNILAEDQLKGNIKLDRSKGTEFQIEFGVVK